MRSRLLVCIAILAFAPLRLLAADDWLLTTADFRSQRVGLAELDDAGASIAVDDKPAERMSWEKLLMLERVMRPVAPAGSAKFVAILGASDRTLGNPVGIEGEILAWENPSLGKLSLSLRSVTAIARIGREPQVSSLQTAQLEDSVTLGNGDVVKGIIVGIENGSVVVQHAAGDKTPVPLDSVAIVSFASTGGKAIQPARGFRITLADGSSVTAAKLKLDTAKQQLSLELPDGQSRSLAMNIVAAIEQVNGPVVWLSSLTPIESVHKPFLDLSWPARMDRGVDGGLLRFGDRIFSRGIGVHSYSHVTFAIRPEWKTFRTLYAVAGDLPYADVTVRIKLDDQVVHEKVSLKNGVLPAPVVIDVAGHQRLALEVDYGSNYDVQDRMNWIEPAFLNFKPVKEEAVPSTAPAATMPASAP